MPDDFLPISSYGLIGNMRTAALVSECGCLDWLCLPYFDSPSVFGAILDRTIGGRFRLAPVDSPRMVRWQHYLPDTNVLVCRVRSDGGIADVIDFMPVGEARHDAGRPSLVRMIRVDHGRMPFRMDCRPAFNYARERHDLKINDFGAVFTSSGKTLLLSSTVPLQANDHGVMCELTIKAGESVVFALLDEQDAAVSPRRVEVSEADALLHDTVQYWRSWISRCTYRGRWREIVRRSALVLKLLTFEPTGAIVAAPTCSLPEHPGGSRNWDYRYAWLRDAAFIVYAFLRIGFTEEAVRFMDWLQQRSHELGPEGMLRPVYGIDGRHELPEEVLPHLEGYMGSKPVRIGNAACEQFQLDVSGSLMDAAYLHNKYAAPLSYDMWVELRKLLDWVCNTWQQPDEGIWEVRGRRQHFVYSKLMCWVALDRGVRLAHARSFPGDVDRWRINRDLLYEQIMLKGWNRDLRTFVQHYDTEALDAANLIMPLVFFIAPNDPRMRLTIKAMDRPMQDGGLVWDFLVYRYDPGLTDDGLDQPEGAFNMCTFWLIEALTRAGHSDRAALEKARRLFERMRWTGSRLGLYAEQTGWHGESLGNYPQGLTHLSLISAAYNLDRAFGDGDS